MFYKLTLFSLLTILTVVRPQPYSDCGSQLSKLDAVVISGCKSDANECHLKRNSNVSISIDLTPSKDVNSVVTDVHGIILDIPIPFPLPQPDACKDSGLACPLKSGEKVKYTATLPVLKSYPTVKVDVKWELKADSGEDLACILISAKIV